MLVGIHSVKANFINYKYIYRNNILTFSMCEDLCGPMLSLVAQPSCRDCPSWYTVLFCTCLAVCLETSLLTFLRSSASFVAAGFVRRWQRTCLTADWASKRNAACAHPRKCVLVSNEALVLVAG